MYYFIYKGPNTIFTYNSLCIFTNSPILNDRSLFGLALLNMNVTVSLIQYFNCTGPTSNKPASPSISTTPNPSSHHGLNPLQWKLASHHLSLAALRSEL